MNKTAEYIFPSSNGYDLLETYTKMLYGERGSFRHNLERYVYSEEFQKDCRMPKTVEEIPELSFAQIRQQIAWEEYMAKRCADMISILDQRERDGTMTDQDYLEVAGIMGLCPGQCDWYETIFPHIVDFFVSSEEEGTAIWESVEAQINVVKVMVTVMSDGLRRGHIIRHNGRDMFSMGYARNFFRGENAYNVRCEPSMYRKQSADPATAKKEKIVHMLRIAEFCLWLNSLSFVQQWPFGDMFHGAIAQHYGIPTNGIDITSDLKTALFFACCKWENNGWRPLRPEEYAEKDSRDRIKSCGGDSRYGVLFTTPADTSNMSTAAKIPELHLAQVTPVGYQPFVRCSSQSAYMIEAGHPYDLYQDPSFAKFKFRLTKEMCEWIYQEMDGGKKVYPEEMFGNCDDIVTTLKESSVFSQAAFLKATENMDEDERSAIQKNLAMDGITIVPEVHLCSEERKAELEKSYWETFQKSNYSTMQAPIRIQFCI